MSVLRMMLARGADGLPAPVPIELASLRLPAWAALLRVAARMERTWPMAEWPERRQAQWVARSRLLNFPDLINGGIVETPGGAGLFLYSRSLVGHSDLGVNAARVAAWRNALAAELAGLQRTE
jgi:uncharacterized protein (DUF1499 family)